VKKIQELPGQELFHYLDAEGKPHCVSYSDVNEYLSNITESRFTAKDFRTWWGTLLAFVSFAAIEWPKSKASWNRDISEVMKRVSGNLGNTPAMCRKCEVHPCLFDKFRDRSLEIDAKNLKRERNSALRYPGEKTLLNLLTSLHCEND
jgi:DNA topoisomerase-1